MVFAVGVAGFVSGLLAMLAGEVAVDGLV